MAIVNDVPGAWEALRAEGERLAALTNVPREIFWAFFNKHGRFPADIPELEAFGADNSNQYGWARRDPATGAWRAIMPGVNPDPRLTAHDRGGFPHMITNAEDSDIQRFMTFDPGILATFGTVNPAPPLPVATGPRTGATASNGQGAVARTMSNPYKGTPYEGAWEAGNPSGTPPPPTPTSAPGGGGAGGAPAAGSAPSGGSAGVGLNDAAARAANDAVLAFLAKRRLEEIDLPVANEQIAASRAERTRQDALAVWKQTYEAAVLTGSYGGSPTLDATKTGADITGYTGGAGTAGNGQRVLDAMAALRTDPTYLAQDGNGRRQMEAARVVQATGGALTQEQALAAVNQMRATTAAGGGFAGAPSQAAQIEGILRGIAPGTATLDRERDMGRLDLDREIQTGQLGLDRERLGLDREKEQNTTLVGVLNLLSTLRGPENAFAYANTLANVPESVRQNIQTAMGRLPVAPRNPAAAGVWNDVRAQQAAAMGVPGAVGAPVMAQDDGLGGSGPAVAPTPAAPFGTAPPPGFFPSMTATTPIGVYGAQPENATPEIVSGAPLMSQDPRGPAPAYGPRTSPAVAAGMQAPNQWSPTAYNKTDPYALKLQLAAYENAGEDPESVQWRYQQSLPRAYGPRTSRLRAA